MDKFVRSIKKSLLKLSKDLQEFSDSCFAIDQEIKGDGRGLTSAFLIERFICEFFIKKLKEYEEYHSGEADLKLSNQPVSFKKIKGATTIALCWSKNPKRKKNGKKSTKRNFLEFPILILNLETQKWWKTKRTKTIDNKIDWLLEIPRGFYIINHVDAKKWVKFSKNNKTNYLVSREQVYKLLFIALKNELHIPIPEAGDKKTWSMIGGVEDKK